jgi:tetratricopeptide (TPR) repeat protein
VSWNRIVLSLSITFTILSSIGHAKELMKISEDELIVTAILYDEYKAFENSYKVYKKLFDDTGAEIYLFKEATSALMSGTHIAESINRLKIWDKKNPNRIEVRRLLIPLYLTIRQVKNATIEAEHLLEQSQEPMDLDLASNSFLYAGDFKRAVDLLSRVYETYPREEILLKMVDIMDQFTGERKKAIQLLETHRRLNMNIVSHDIYAKLLLLYQKEKDIDGLLETYKALYKLNNDEEYLSRIIDVYIYKRDIQSAITFLEQDQTRKDILYELYKREKQFAKALGLVDELYNEDKDAKWIAEKGVLIFENSKDKNDKKMIRDVISHFEKAIELGNDDSIYLNYYGYTLIDKEVDVKKGIDIIENALIQQPDNMYYLDSLAWGYYKERQCDKAYKLMKRVVEEEGLTEPEIKEHWDAIRQCK